MCGVHTVEKNVWCYESVEILFGKNTFTPTKISPVYAQKAASNLQLHHR
jgi:hypothetical protein